MFGKRPHWNLVRKPLTNYLRFRPALYQAGRLEEREARTSIPHLKANQIMWEHRYWILLHSVEGIGPATYHALIRQFGSPEDVFSTASEEIAQLPRLSLSKAEKILRAVDRMDQIEALIAQLEQEEIYLLSVEDSAYPQPLRSVKHPPPLLYVAGRITPEDDHAVAIVGSRDASQRGLQIARGMAKRLSQQGITIVSGYARGIDTAAHLGALEAEEGRTFMVLSEGILHFKLRGDAFESKAFLADRGAILSEQFPTVRWAVGGAMARNRIVVGLSKAILVVECGEKSGTMNTAKVARAMNKPLFVLDYKEHPPPGNRKLLREGAIPIPSYRNLDRVYEQVEVQGESPRSNVQRPTAEL